MLTLVREPSGASCTFGVLWVDGRFECHTLEDVVRPAKIAGVTAIPAGTYPVEITASPKFGRRLPLLMGVPNFSGVRIHAGNRSRDTEGCILPGRGRDGDAVTQSLLAFAELFRQIDHANEAGDTVRIRIVSAAEMFPMR